MNPVVKYLLVVVVTITGHMASAQILNEDTTTNQPFFKATKFSSKCYIGLDASAVQILKTKAAGNFGANLNWVVNHKYVISLDYEELGSPTNVQKLVEPTENDTIRLIHRYIGLGFSYIAFDNKLFSLQPELSAGWGHINYVFNNVNYHDNFAEIVPAVSATYNCTKYFRVGLGLNYRLAIGTNLNGIKSADISGVGGVIFIKVGTF